MNIGTGNSATLTTQEAVWALGDYARMAEEVMAPLGPVLVDAVGMGPGDRVLDVAAGSGNISIPAARTGAAVVSSDLTPELLQRSRQRAAKHGVALDWRQADAEQLPFSDNEFDAVISAIGVMFAPHHQRAADELVRVCRPRGTIGVISWTPDGFFGRMLAAIRPYRPTVAPGTPPAALWGRGSYVLGLLGSGVSEMQTQRRTLQVDRFDSPEACHQYFRRNYGPTIDAYRNIGDNAVLARALDNELISLAGQYWVDGIMEWGYLLVSARKR
ncbi:MAG: methyltransferase domain-containing protein [Mycobacterium sp.]|uniref:class I SAM-dependent methyltransferase n=1 Tax=Mycobacterium sp. TaxID=1785 RepID=UPI003CC61FA9